MTLSTSMALSQALLVRAISHYGSNSTSDRVSLSATLTLPSFADLKSTSSSSLPSTSCLSHRRLNVNRPVRTVAVKTLDKTTETLLVEKLVNTIRFLGFYGFGNKRVDNWMVVIVILIGFAVVGFKKERGPNSSEK
ncbi:hypothetical protein ACFX1S_024516 [Malus domestica]